MYIGKARKFQLKSIDNGLNSLYFSSMNIKTKIVCTLGPASESPEMIRKLLKAGMGVARFNCSHGSVEENRGKIMRVKEAVRELKTNTILALDTKGPDVRLGMFAENKKITLVVGQDFTFYFGEKHKDLLGGQNSVFVAHDKLPKILRVGAKLGLNDGTTKMTVTKITPDSITARVDVAGVISNRKALAAPGFDLQLPFISPEDVLDIELAVETGCDWIMASAVSKPSDVIELRALLKKLGNETIKIISKLEDRLGIKNIDAIIQESDGIMVARGGLGADLPIETLPAIQKMIIERTKKAGKFVINATMVFETMTDKPSPTRAEVCDVANAIWDGADFVMFSAETAAGKFPIETVEFALLAAADAEAHPEYYRKY